MIEEAEGMLRDAGLVSVYMGIQSSERVTGHLYDRRVKNQSIEDIARILNLFDNNVVTKNLKKDDKRFQKHN